MHFHELTLNVQVSEVNRLVKFVFVSQHQNCGGVAVHLHHSTRTIQVQGSHKMPDNSKAALWFVKNVIVKKFKEKAKVKKVCHQEV